MVTGRLTSRQVRGKALPIAVVLTLVLAAFPLLGLVGRDAGSVASDTLNQEISGYSQFRSYLRVNGASAQATAAVDNAISQLQSALDSLARGGNISDAEAALRNANNAFPNLENDTAGLGNRTSSEEAESLNASISRAQSRASQILSYVQQAGNTTAIAQLRSNVTAAIQLLDTASIQLRAGNLTAAEGSLHAAKTLLDQANLALGSEQSDEEISSNMTEYQGRLAGAINATLLEISHVRGLLTSSNLTQAQVTNATRLLDNATTLLNGATVKLSDGDTQGAWASFNQAKILVYQAQRMVEGEDELDD
jgi:hypothetical protein